MNTLQIFPALILLARLQKTLLAATHTARSSVLAVSYPSSLGQILSRLTQCGEYNVSKEGASHSPSSPFHAGRRKMLRLSNPTPKSTPESICPIGVSSALLKREGWQDGMWKWKAAEADSRSLSRSLARPLGDHCCPRRILTRRKSIGARTNDCATAYADEEGGQGTPRWIDDFHSVKNCYSIECRYGWRKKISTRGAA